MRVAAVDADNESAIGVADEAEAQAEVGVTNEFTDGEGNEKIDGAKLTFRLESRSLKEDS